MCVIYTRLTKAMEEVVQLYGEEGAGVRALWPHGDEMSVGVSLSGSHDVQYLLSFLSWQVILSFD